MKRQSTIQHVLLSVILTLGILSGNASAQPDFFDDFSDGDPADGSPVLWHPIFVWDGAGYTLTPEGLDVAGALLTNSDGTIPVYDDVAITTEIRRHANDSGAEWASGFLFRYNENWTNGYWLEVRAPNRFLLGHHSGAILAQSTLPFNVDEQDIMIHMEAKGQQIEGWCWAKGQPMPNEAQISVFDMRRPKGQIALHAWTVGGQSIFRSVKVHSLHTPIVDFNGDGVLDTTDLVTFIESWGQDNPTTDFWHDGTVNKKDLEILMSCWGQEVDDPTLKACWKLDETEGDIAYDSAATNDAIFVGDAGWQPDSGQVHGALQLDGIDDYVSTPFALDPGAGPFSVLAWIKGGQPGEVIVTQQDGANWLLTDTQGKLMTDLKSEGRRPGEPLVSEAIITDADWHRIALTWDGSNRTLYVDSEQVGTNTQLNVKSCQECLLLGVGCDLAPASFFTGLIDDVRIYDRVVVP